MVSTEATTVGGMRRLNSLLRAPLVFGAMSLLYAIARWAATVGQPIARFPDSPGYQHLTFVGTNERFWVVPFVYSFMHSDSHRVIAQVACGVAVWTYMAWQMGGVSRFRRTAMVSVFLLGLTPQVIHFDSAILSESLGISFAVGAVAATLHVSRSASRLPRVLWLVLVVFTAFTRPTHLVIVFTCAGYFLLKYLFSRDQRTRTWALLFVALSLWGLMQLRGNELASTVNFYTVLQRRICTNNDAYNWFVAHGMPVVEGLREVRGYGRASQLDDNVREIVQLPVLQMPPMSMIVGGVELARWVRDHGWSTYTQYIAVHPSHAINVLRSKASKTLSPSNESFLPTHTRTLIPHGLFDPWWAWLLIAATTLTIAWLSRAKIQMVLAATYIGVLTVLVSAISMLASAIEYERHGVTGAVMLRVLALVSLALASSSTKATEPSEVADARA